MYTAIFTLWNICIFRRGPEHLPALPKFLLVTIFLGLFVNALSVPIASSETSTSTLTLIAMLPTQFALYAITIYVMLKSRSTPDRLYQTLSAWYGTHAIIAALTILVVNITSSVAAVQVAAFVMLFGWQTAVHGFVLHRSLTTTFLVGIAIAFAMEVLIGIVIFNLFDIQIP